MTDVAPMFENTRARHILDYLKRESRISLRLAWQIFWAVSRLKPRKQIRKEHESPSLPRQG
jgi:hypothetical protein